MTGKIAKYKTFSNLDLKNAYHQVEIDLKYKSYTAFDICGQFYQLRRIRFGGDKRRSQLPKDHR